MKKGILTLLSTLLTVSIVGCGPSGSSSTISTDSQNSSEKSVISVNYPYTMDGTLVDIANEQLTLVNSYLRQPVTGVLTEQDNRIRRANLWTYSAYFTMVNQMNVIDKNPVNEQMLQEAYEELDWYRATQRSDEHLVYASDNGKEVPAFFDDNVWLVIGFINAYKTTNNAEYLEKAKAIQEWIYTGWHEEKGGLLWREFPDDTDPSFYQRNTCINGPAAWASLLLYEITEDRYYRDWGIKIYTWTKKTLLNKVDNVYYDNINEYNDINKWQFTYNTGTMMSTAALLYKYTGSDTYKSDVDDLVTGANNVFNKANAFSTVPNGEFHNDNPWFRVYLLQGYLDAMMHVDINYGVRLESVKIALLYGYNNHKDSKGFILEDWSGRKVNELGEGKVKTLNAVGNVECIAILARYEAYLNEVTK